MAYRWFEQIKTNLYYQKNTICIKRNIWRTIRMLQFTRIRVHCTRKHLAVIKYVICLSDHLHLLLLKFHLLIHSIELPIEIWTVIERENTVVNYRQEDGEIQVVKEILGPLEFEWTIFLILTMELIIDEETRTMVLVENELDRCCWLRLRVMKMW